MSGTVDTTVGPDWYKDFFNGVTLDFWRRLTPPEVTEKEVDFLIKQLKVKPGAKLLDAPCGNGRHALLLGRLGFKTTGIDLSEEFIEEARAAGTEYGDSVEFICDDMRNIPSNGEFDGGFCFGNSFGYFEHGGCEEFFEACSRAFKKGARFLIDTGVVAEVLIPNLKERDVYTIGDLTMTIENRYHAESSCFETKFTFEQGGEIEERHSLHYVFTTGEVNRMLAKNGFRLVSMFSDPDGEPFKLGARRLFILSEKA